MSRPSGRPVSAVWAVVPVKCFDRGKSRLAAVLDAAAREQLARSSCGHVLDALARSRRLDGVLVVTDCEAVLAHAAARGATGQLEAEVAGGAGALGRIVDAALADVAARGATAALVLMSDLPRLATDDVDRVLGLLSTNDFVVTPDHRDEGTNALALPLPARFTTSFGNVDSFARHRATAERLGARLGVYRHPRLAVDVDEPADLELIEAMTFATAFD